MKPKRAGSEPGLREARQLARQGLATEQLLNVAEALFSDRGLDKTTLRAIAEAAEMSIGGVYQSFAGKQELYRAVFARRADLYHTGLADAMANSPTALGQLASFVSYTTTFYKEHPRWGRLILRHAGPTLFAGADFIDPEQTLGFEGSSAVLATIIQHGQETGEFRPGDSQTFMRLVSAVMLAHMSTDPAIVDEVATTTPLSADDLTDLLARLLRP